MIRKLFTIIFAILIGLPLHADLPEGNPFKHLGYKANVATFSDNEEFHDQLNIVQIGSVWFDTETEKVVGFVQEQDTLVELKPALISTSIDPHCEKYYSISPYAYCFNNPVNVVDPDGRDGIYITFPDYMVDTETKLGKQPLGHSGVLLIDNNTGLTKYYEYGRYPTSDGTKGRVRNVSVPNVTIGEDGMPTAESLNKVLSSISEKSGQGGDIEGAYIKSDKFEEMNTYATEKLNESTVGKKGYDKDRESYSLLGNNCATFASDVLKQDKNVSVSGSIVKTPGNIADSYRDKYDKVNYNKTNGATIVPTKSIINRVKDFLGF